MLIVALVLAVVSLAALVTAVVTSNDVLAWVCIGLSALGVLLLIVDAIRDRHRRAGPAPAELESERTEVMEPVTAAATAVIEPVTREFGEPDPQEGTGGFVDYPEVVEDQVEDQVVEDQVDEDHPEELVDDDPDHDMPSDDEPVYPESAEEAAMHAVTMDAPSGGAEPDGDYDDTAASVLYASESSAATDSYIVIYPEDSYTAEAADPVSDMEPDRLSEAEETGHQ